MKTSARNLWKKAAALAVAAGMLAATSLSTAFAEGAVDWEGQKVVVTGMGIAPPTAVNAAQARMLARRAAVAEGYRQLAEQVNGVQVDAESTVENMMALSDVIRTKVSACIKGAVVVDERIAPDGVYEVRMEVPMYGVSNSLAAAVLQRPMTKVPFPAPALERDEYEQGYGYVHGQRNGYESQTVPGAAPSVHVEVNINQNAPQAPGRGTANGSPVRYAAGVHDYYSEHYPQYRPPQDPPQAEAKPAPSAKKPKKREKQAQAVQIAGDYTSLVIDCTGLGLRPAMSPVIQNEQGEAIYGATNLDYDLVTAKGMAAYWTDLDVSTVDRAGDNPLVVKCVSLSGNNVNPVLTMADANRVLRENERSHFLDKMNVIFIR